MDLHEVELHLMDTTRTKRLQLETLKAKVLVAQNDQEPPDLAHVSAEVFVRRRNIGAGFKVTMIKQKDATIQRLYETEFVLQMPGVRGEIANIPYQWIEECWISTANTISIHLKAIIEDGDHLMPVP